MSHADLSADRWFALSDEAARRVAAAIAAENGLRLVDVRGHDFGGRPGRVAEFDRDGLGFCLVPGARARLGFDGASFVPTAGQAASYAESAEEHNLPELTGWVDSWTSTPRDVDIPALLVAVDSLDLCVRPLPLDAPAVTAVVASRRKPLRNGYLRVMDEDQNGGVTVSFDARGRVHAAHAVATIGYDEALRRIAERGLRTCSPDEWEYACGAGGTTLFRWGNDCPTVGYPVAGLAGPHRDRNRWGLLIGQDPAHPEWTGEPGVVCGGDGGSFAAAYGGSFLAWLPLATAYRDRSFGTRSLEWQMYELRMRPVVEVR